MAVANRSIPVPFIIEHAALQASPGAPGRTFIIRRNIAYFKKTTVPFARPFGREVRVIANAIRNERIVDRDGAWFDCICKPCIWIKGRNGVVFGFVFWRFEIK